MASRTLPPWAARQASMAGPPWPPDQQRHRSIPRVSNGDRHGRVDVGMVAVRAVPTGARPCAASRPGQVFEQRAKVGAGEHGVEPESIHPEPPAGDPAMRSESNRNLSR